MSTSTSDAQPQKVALITGSARSIGAAIAQRLAAAGYAVTINHVSPTSSPIAHSLASSINASSNPPCIRAHVIQADVCDESGAKKILNETLEKFGRVDVLVLNAAVMEVKTLDKVDGGMFDRCFGVNVKGPLFLIKETVKHMKPGGRVIFIGTSLTKSTHVSPNFLLSCATKGALEQIARVLAKDLGARNITANTVSPGATDTDLFRRDKSPEQIAAIAASSPAKRLGKPDEVAAVVEFLASEAAGWVNGQVIGVNGGQTV